MSIEQTCVKCGQTEPLLPGVTLISVNGKLEQACIDEFQGKRPPKNEGRPKAQGGHKRDTNLTQ